MPTTREYRPSDAADLATIFYRSMREVACRCYGAAQVEAWAPAVGDPCGWNELASDGRITIAAVNEADKPVVFGNVERNGHVFERKRFNKIRRNDFERRGVPIHNFTMAKSLLAQSFPPLLLGVR